MKQELSQYPTILHLKTHRKRWFSLEVCGNPCWFIKKVFDREKSVLSNIMFFVRLFVFFFSISYILRGLFHPPENLQGFIYSKWIWHSLFSYFSPSALDNVSLRDAFHIRLFVYRLNFRYVARVCCQFRLGISTFIF